MASAASHHAQDRRGTIRKRSVLAIGKITMAKQEVFCFVRDISEGGACIDTPHEIAIDDRMTLEMRGLRPCSARAVWRDGRLVGLAFDHPQDVERLSQRAPDERGFLARAPRFTVNRLVQFRVASVELTADLINVSAGGARLLVPRDMKLDGPGQLIITGIREPLTGYVRWMSQAGLGFRFAPMLDRQTLLRILD